MSRFVIGDIHGMYNKMIKALKFAGFDSSKDMLYGVGDFCDRGPDSLKVLKYLLNLGDRFKSVFGNHDFWLWQFLQLDLKYTKAEDVKPSMIADNTFYDVTDDGSLVSWTSTAMPECVIDCWIHNGGDKTISSLSGFSQKQLTDINKWLNKMPYRIELEDYVIQHTFCGLQQYYFPEADYSVTMEDLIEQSKIDIGYDSYFWDRKFLSYSKTLCGKDSYPMSEQIKEQCLKKTLIVGHTPVLGFDLKPVPVFDKELNFVLLDTGAFVSKPKYNVIQDGELSVMNLDTHQWFTSAGEQGQFDIDSLSLC